MLRRARNAKNVATPGTVTSTSDHFRRLFESDFTGAIYDGKDAVVLCVKTAVGSFPLERVCGRKICAPLSATVYRV